MNTHKSILWLLFTSSFLLVNIPSLLSQEMGDGFFRLGILELTSTRYEDDHPFGQMTGDDSFDDPPVSIVPSTSWLEKVDEQTNRENVFQQYLFHALPPFSVEYIVPSTLGVFPVAYSWSYYQTTVREKSAYIAQLSNRSVEKVPYIDMRTYYHFLGVNFHFLDTQQGMSASYGIGILRIDGIYNGGFHAQSDGTPSDVSQGSFVEAGMPYSNLAFDIQGTTFGFRFGIYFLRNHQTIIDSNENVFIGKSLSENPQTSVTFGGILIRTALLWKLNL